jgi:hypothetical protein
MMHHILIVLVTSLVREVREAGVLLSIVYRVMMSDRLYATTWLTTPRVLNRHRLLQGRRTSTTHIDDGGLWYQVALY